MTPDRSLVLYFAPGACSISPHIALREAGVPFVLNRVDLREKKTQEGESFIAINPKGSVPALKLPDGQILTEGAAMVQYIADLSPTSQIAPPPGSFERVRLQEWLNFIATELHKGLAPLYRPAFGDDYKTQIEERFVSRLGQIAEAVASRPFLMGERFTVADGYAFYVLRAWKVRFERELPEALGAYYARVATRPSVKAALGAEGLTA